MENYIKNMKDIDLIAFAEDIYDMIYVVECFGAKDMVYLEMAINELGKRGFTVIENKKLKISK